MRFQTVIEVKRIRNKLRLTQAEFAGLVTGTVIDVDERNRRAKICNYTHNLIDRTFGRQEHPAFEEYEAFLESRCFPGSRDKMKLVLRGLDLPFYDPFLIIEKTQGRMAEDDQWIRIER